MADHESSDPGLPNPPGGSDWTDQQLDAALAGLYRADEPSERALASARSILLGNAENLGRPASPSGSAMAHGLVGEVMPTVGVASPEKPAAATDQETAPRRPRRWRRRAALACAVAAVVAAALILPTLHWGTSTPPASAAAAAALNKAADAASTIGAMDDVLKPGQYRYIDTDAWYMAMSSGTDGKMQFAVLQQSRTQQWVPADWHDNWMERRSSTGAQKWIVGTEAEAKAAGMDPNAVPPPTPPEMKGPCQNYFDDMCTSAGGWQEPTKAWMAALPRDPAALYARLAADTKGHGSDPNTEMLVYATDALRTGLLPADVRAALYRALAKVPGMEIADSTANLDGTVGVAFGIEDASTRDETIIDPATGAFIGEREISTEAAAGIPTGTVTGYTAVHAAVVDKIGGLPTK